MTEEPVHRRRWPLPVAVVVGVVVVLVGALGVLFLTREDPGAKSVEEAAEELRSRTTGTVPPGAAPAAGVYEATGEGDEALSLPGISQTDGDVLPVTVEPVSSDETCWRFRVDYNEAHWQDWTYCRTAAGLVDVGGTTYQRWDFGALVVENTSDFTCDPPSLVDDPVAEPGATWDQTCEGTSSEIEGLVTSSGPATFVGVDELEIGGEVVPARHHRQERSLSGAQTGTTVNEVWFAVDTGLPVRMEREAEIDSDSPVGSITYTESGWWQLTSTEPVT